MTKSSCVEFVARQVGSRNLKDDGLSFCWFFGGEVGTSIIESKRVCFVAHLNFMKEPRS